MLDIADDQPLVRNAILKRIGKEKGVGIADIKMIAQQDHLQVGVWLILTDSMSDVGIVDVTGFFDLPKTFTHRHLLNEIDEICEQVKKARRLAPLSAIRAGPALRREVIGGTGLRGRWPKDKARAPVLELARERS